MVVQKKRDKTNLMQFLMDEFEELRSTPVLNEQWLVIEVIPGYTESGYYGNIVPESRLTVYVASTEKEAQDWADSHESDRGNLVIKKQNLREFKYTRWVDY